MKKSSWGILSAATLLVWLFVMSQPLVGVFSGFQVLFWQGDESWARDSKPVFAFIALAFLSLVGYAFYRFSKKD